MYVLSPFYRHYLTPTWWLRLKWQQVGPKTYLCKSFTKFKCFHVKTLIFTILHWSCTSRLCVHDQIWSTSNIYVTLQDFHNIKLFFLNQANKLNQSRAVQSVSELVDDIGSVWWLCLSDQPCKIINREHRGGTKIHHKKIKITLNVQTSKTSCFSLNPFTPKISFATLHTVYHTIHKPLIWRIWHWINNNNLLINIFLYSHHLSGWYCTNIVRRNSLLVTRGGLK